VCTEKERQTCVQAGYDETNNVEVNATTSANFQMMMHEKYAHRRHEICTDFVEPWCLHPGITTTLHGRELKDVTYIFQMFKIQVLEILHLPPPLRK
jgi:hypothetical protein